MYEDAAGRLWLRTSPEIQQRARELRQAMTPAEALLWERLRNGQVGGLRFRRQHPLGPYIFDFFCRELALVIELDGGIHDDPLQQENDVERDAQCRAYGLTVLRFANREVIQNPDSVVASVLHLRCTRSRK